MGIRMEEAGKALCLTALVAVAFFGGWCARVDFEAHQPKPECIATAAERFEACAVEIYQDDGVTYCRALRNFCPVQP